MRLLTILLIFFGITANSQYKYHNFEYSKDYYKHLQKRVDYDKISSYILNHIDKTVLKDKLLFIPFYLPECRSCDEAVESTESEAMNEISYSAFWNENTFRKFLKKFSDKKVIVTTTYFENGSDPIEKEVVDKFGYLKNISKTIGIKKRYGIYPEEIYVFNNVNKEKIEIDENKISGSDFLVITLRPYHNNVNGKEMNLKTSRNFLVIRLELIAKGNHLGAQYFLYDYDSKQINIASAPEISKKLSLGN